MTNEVDKNITKWLSSDVRLNRLKALDWDGVRDLVIDKLKKEGYNPAECDVDGIIVTACKMYALLIPGYNVLVSSEYDNYITKEFPALSESDKATIHALQRCGRSYEHALQEVLDSSSKPHDIVKEFTIPAPNGKSVKVYVRYPAKPLKYLSYGYLREVAKADKRRDAKIALVINQ